MSTKIKISLDDPEVREVWNAALEAKREVASWPAWKRGEDATTTTTSSGDSAPSPLPAPGTKQ